MDLKLDNANVKYYENFVSETLGNSILKEFSEIMEQEETKFVTTQENSKHKLNRKTLVCVDKDLTNYVS